MFADPGNMAATDVKEGVDESEIARQGRYILGLSSSVFNVPEAFLRARHGSFSGAAPQLKPARNALGHVRLHLLCEEGRWAQDNIPRWGSGLGVSSGKDANSGIRLTGDGKKKCAFISARTVSNN